MNYEQDLQDFRRAFVIAVGDSSPFAREALKRFDGAYALLSKLRTPVADEQETVHNAAIKAAAKVCADIARQYDPQNDQENALASELYSAAAAILRLAKEHPAALSAQPGAQK